MSNITVTFYSAYATKTVTGQIKSEDDNYIIFTSGKKTYTLDKHKNYISYRTFATINAEYVKEWYYVDGE